MRLTYSFNHYYDLGEFDKLFEASKNLYNQANYIVRQEFINNHKYLGYIDMDTQMKKELNLENEINYRLLKAQTSQQCLRELDKSWKSFFALIKLWVKNPKMLTGKPNLPGYKKSDYNHVCFTKQNCTIKEDVIKLSKELSLKIPKYKGKDFENTFRQVRIHPTKFDYVKVEIVYEQDLINSNLDEDKYASIDLGIDNLVTMVSSHDQPVIFNGKPIKSINQLYNKTKSKLCSIKDKMKIKKYTKRLTKLEEDRYRNIKDYMHKTSRKIVNYLLDNKIHKLVVGYNTGWKCGVALGNKTNQKFVQIPHTMILNQLKYKCNLVGVEVIVNEESYTSKVDSLALEHLGKNDLYLGKRVKRGLFQSSVGKLINADVNGALNILRKVLSDSVVKQIIDRGLLFNPLKIRNCFAI